MADESKDAILIEIGKLQGTVAGHKDRLDQQHQDILRLSAELADHKATFLRCFADAEERNTKALDKAIGQLTDLFSAKVQLAAQSAAETVLNHVSRQSLPVKEFIQTRPYTAVGGAGIIVALLNWAMTQWGVVSP